MSDKHYSERLQEEEEGAEGACKVCGEPTNVIFNINLRALPICEDCATNIFLQQASWYAHPKS